MGARASDGAIKNGTRVRAPLQTLTGLRRPPLLQLCQKRFNGVFICKQLQAKVRCLHLRFCKLADGAAKTLHLAERDSVRIWTVIMHHISPLPSTHQEYRRGSTFSASTRSRSPSSPSPSSYTHSGATRQDAEGRISWGAQYYVQHESVAGMEQNKAHQGSARADANAGSAFSTCRSGQYNTQLPHVDQDGAPFTSGNAYFFTFQLSFKRLRKFTSSRYYCSTCPCGIFVKYHGMPANLVPRIKPVAHQPAQSGKHAKNTAGQPHCKGNYNREAEEFINMEGVPPVAKSTGNAEEEPENSTCSDGIEPPLSEQHEKHETFTRHAHDGEGIAHEDSSGVQSVESAHVMAVLHHTTVADLAAATRLLAEILHSHNPHQ